MVWAIRNKVGNWTLPESQAVNLPGNKVGNSSLFASTLQKDRKTGVAASMHELRRPIVSPRGNTHPSETAVSVGSNRSA
jgi:hypothetical protein